MYNVKMWEKKKKKKMYWHDSVEGKSYNHYHLQRRKETLIINIVLSPDQDFLEK